MLFSMLSITDDPGLIWKPSTTKTDMTLNLSDDRMSAILDRDSIKFFGKVKHGGLF